MPTLLQSLQTQDIGQLHIIAGQWGIELQAPDVRQGRSNLAAALLDNPALIAEVVEALPTEGQSALADLLSQGGQIPWHLFTQQFGEVREMGPGRRDREQPYLHPISITERLWYFALIARAFFDTPGGPQEFAYIPEDLRPQLPDYLRLPPPVTPLSRPATPTERAYPLPVNDHILDHATTLLAALRMGMPETHIEEIGADWEIPVPTLTSLLDIAGLLDLAGMPRVEEVRQFLEAKRGAALAQLTGAWLASEEHDDLRLIPYLEAEGEWLNNPLQARQAALALLETLDADTWYSLPAFISSVKTHHPDFLRPSGDYQSWYLKDTRTNQYLRGFEHWAQVEGAFLHHLVTGPLHWLGLVELAAPTAEAEAGVFRRSPWYAALRAGTAPQLPLEEEPPALNSQGHILVPRLAPRAVRYLIARFCEWETPRKGIYHYRITPRSLAAAEDQGLKIKHLLALLRRFSSQSLPPNALQALERWQKHGTQISFQQTVVLRVNHPDVLQALLESRAKRFLGTQLGPTTITVNQGALPKVMDILMQLGYLSDAALDE